MGPGSQVTVQTPQGLLTVTIPAGMSAGEVFMVGGAAPPAAPAAPAEGEADVVESDYEPYVPMPEVSFNMTDPCESLGLFMACPCKGWQTKRLVIQDQEVFFTVKDLLRTTKQRRPYAQLGSVDKHTTFYGCHTLVSDFAPLDENGQGGLEAGCLGTDTATIDAVVAELQNRKRLRGGIGQIRKLDYVLGKAAKLATQLPLLAKSLGINIPRGPMPVFEREVLERKTIDISAILDPLFCTHKSLELTEEEAILSINNLCMQFKQSREYGEIGFVEKKKTCFCCFAVSSDLSPVPGQGDFAPGCACANRGKVNLIVQELRDRMATRGQVGQIKKQEKILGFVSQMEDTMNVVKGSLNLPFPPSQQEMTAKFGEHPPKLGVPIVHEPPCKHKEHDMTNRQEAWMNFCCTCGCAGCMKEQVTLDEDYMWVNTKDNFDDSNVKIPYAEVDSVDVTRRSCCYWSVNEMSPGCGCNKAKVLELEADLQERKEKRGNIAQLKQLRAMQATAAGLGILGERLCENQGVELPPTQEQMTAVWNGRLPRGLTMGEIHVHIEPDKDFPSTTYDVTNYSECICNCLCSLGLKGCLKTRLELGPDEVMIVREDCCNRWTSRSPYGNLGSVETELECCCCHSLPEVATPGCGCDKAFVEKIAEDLQERKVKRGNIAQMQQQENIIKEVLSLEVKMDLLCHKHGVAYPPTPEVMAEMFLPKGAALPPQTKPSDSKQAWDA